MINNFRDNFKIFCQFVQPRVKYAIIYQLKQNLLFDILPNHEKSWFFGSIGVIKLLIDTAILVAP